MNMRKKICYVMTFIMMVTAMFAGLSFASQAATGDLGEGYNVSNFTKYFSTVDDGVIDTTSNGVVTVLVFARTNGNCANSNAVVSGLCGSNWVQDDRVRVAVVDIDKASKDVVTQMRDGNPASTVTFSYCENNAANNAMWDYLAMTVGDSDTVTLPVTVIIDDNNMVQYCLTGYQTSETIYTYVKALVGEDFVEFANPNEFSLFVEGTYDEKMAFEVMDLVNEARAGQGLDALKMDEGLMEAAMQRAAECAVYYSHTRPNGESCFTVLDNSYRMGCAENIAAGYSSSAGVMDGWLNSEGHYANIMGGSYTNIGVGCFYQDGAVYWVQLFSTYGANQVTQPENYVATAEVKTKYEYMSSFYFGYPSNIEVGTSEKPAMLYGKNLGFSDEPYNLSPKTFAFESANTDIATVDADGTVHALATNGTSIKANLSNPGGDKISLSCVVTIVEASSSGDNGNGDNMGNGDGNNGNTETGDNTGNGEGNRNPDYVPPTTGFLVTGDVDFNGTVDLTDAQLALKFALKIYIPYDLEAFVADYDFDNAVTLSDAQLILKKALMII